MAELGKYFETASLGRNRYQTTLGIKPVNYHDGSIWKRISNNWADSGNGDRPHIVTTAPFMVGVSPDGLRRIHPTREQDVWFEMSGAKINQAGSWNVVQLGTPTSRVDNRITWNRPNFNAYMDMGGHFVKLGYLLKNGYLPPNNQFAYEVATNGLTRQGGTLLKDGVPVMHMRKPVAYDHDNSDDVRQIAHEITRIDGKWHVVFTLPDLTGMSKPLIDPTLTLQPDANAGFDGKTRENAADTSYETSATLAAHITAASRQYPLHKFDLSSIAGATITSAVLSFWNAAQVAIDRVYTMRNILAANSGWVEACTWNYADGAGASDRWAGDTGNNGGADAGCSVDGTDVSNTALGTYSYSSDTAADTKHDSTLTTAQIQIWLDSSNYGFRTYVNGTAATITWHSSDSLTAAYRPKLVTNYTLPDTAGNPRILQKMRLGY